MAKLVEHIEAYLGSINYGWSVSPDGEPLGFQIVKLAGLQSSYVPYVSLGMSNYPLRSDASSRDIWQELLFLAPLGFGDKNIPALLQSVVSEAIGLERAYLRGQVIGPRGNLFEGYPFTALYVSLPAYLPDSFKELRVEGRAIVFGWLIPITDREAEFVLSQGWEAFEDLLERKDPDLVDLARLALV